MAEEQQQQSPRYPQYPQYQYQKKNSNWWIPVLIIAIIVILFFVLAIGFFSAMGSFMFSEQEVEVKSNSVLHLKYSGELGEYVKSSPFSIFDKGKKASFSDILTALDRAKDDEKIKGVFYEAGNGSMGYAKAVELQKALEDFKESGKFVYAFIEIGTEMDYFHALPADKIYAPEEGITEMNGFGYTSLFFKEMFKEIGIDFYVLGFEDFKSAAEPFSRTSYSDSARYQLEVLLKQRMDVYASAVEKHRNIKKDKFYEVLNHGYYSVDSLMELGLYDGYKTRADVIDIMKDEIFGEDRTEEDKIRLISPGKYMASNPPLNGTVADAEKQIAIIYAEGPIQQDAGDDNPFSDEKIITPKKLVEYLSDAKKDDKVKAVILRVNTPGGSVIASDAIRQEIINVREKKPVYISMSDVSASGGYYIAMDCDTIIAAPETITGSIGVVMSIPNLTGLKNKISLHVDTVSSTDAAQFLNGFYPIPEQDKQKIYGMAKAIYDRFLKHVAKARGMTYEEVRSIAKGRVWTGEDAKKIGLIDVLGGYEEAIKIAKRRIGVPDTMLVYVQTYPKKKDEIQELLEMFGLDTPGDDNGGAGANIAKLARALKENSSEAAVIYKSLPKDIRRQVDYALQILDMSEHEKVLMAMPYLLEEK